MLKNTGSFWYCNCQPIIWMLRFIDILFVFIYFVIFVERYRIASFMLQLLNGLTSMKRSMVLVRFLFVCFCYSTTNKNENISLDQRIRCLNCFIMDFSVRICLSVCVCACVYAHTGIDYGIQIFVSLFILNLNGNGVCGVLPKEVAIILPNFWGHCFLALCIVCAKNYAV